MYDMFEMLSTSRLFRRLYEKRCECLIKEYGLKIAELDILYFLSYSGIADTAKDIIREEHVSKAYISKSVDSLRNKGFISLQEDLEDRRRVHIAVTKQGEPVISALKTIREGLCQDLARNITEDEKQQLFLILNKISDNITSELN